jgi:hypothetical protein
MAALMALRSVRGGLQQLANQLILAAGGAAIEHRAFAAGPRSQQVDDDWQIVYPRAMHPIDLHAANIRPTATV